MGMPYRAKASVEYAGGRDDAIACLRPDPFAGYRAWSTSTAYCGGVADFSEINPIRLFIIANSTVTTMRSRRKM